MGKFYSMLTRFFKWLFVVFTYTEYSDLQNSSSDAYFSQLGYLMKIDFYKWKFKNELRTQISNQNLMVR
jgi:cell division protein FtsI/penicillin-binding protein 2